MSREKSEDPGDDALVKDSLKLILAESGFGLFV